VPGAQPLDPVRIRQFGLMISDKQAGPFELLVDWIDVALTRAAPDLSH
jgi:hypothetical protein